VEDLSNYIDKGGIIFSILLLISAIGISLIIYKILELTFFIDYDFRNLEDSLEKSKTIDNFKNLVENLPESEKTKLLTNVFKIINTNKSRSLKEEEIEILLQKKYLKSQRFLPSLEIIAQVSPLVGLLGTVIGMIDSFNELELGGSLVDPSILAGGIWTALLTTAMGLIVAIPALISHYFFEKKLSNSIQLANAFLTKLIGKSNV
jgi:biopolymer transport protein ExbB|tara:strand:+ start:1552 stop:2166 length:615 start_codon:yes stop_codon:yes gene_type:complete